jgi:hypothetical protein
MGTVAFPGDKFRKDVSDALSWMPRGYRTPEAIELLVGTAARESRLGKFPDRPGTGGVGVFQINPNTEAHLWSGYLRKNPKLAEGLSRHTGVSGPNPEALSGNFPYAAAMARLAYTKAFTPIPKDPAGMANYWKEHYNTAAGKGTPEGFLETYYELVKGGKK